MSSSSRQETVAQLARTPAMLCAWLGDLPADGPVRATASGLG